MKAANKEPLRKFDLVEEFREHWIGNQASGGTIHARKCQIPVQRQKGKLQQMLKLANEEAQPISGCANRHRKAAGKGTELKRKAKRTKIMCTNGGHPDGTKVTVSGQQRKGNGQRPACADMHDQNAAFAFVYSVWNYKCMRTYISLYSRDYGGTLAHVCAGAVEAQYSIRPGSGIYCWNTAQPRRYWNNPSEQGNQYNRTVCFFDYFVRGTKHKDQVSNRYRGSVNGRHHRYATGEQNQFFCHLSAGQYCCGTKFLERSTFFLHSHLEHHGTMSRGTIIKGLSDPYSGTHVTVRPNLTQHIQVYDYGDYLHRECRDVHALPSGTHSRVSAAKSHKSLRVSTRNDSVFIPTSSEHQFSNVHGNISASIGKPHCGIHESMRPYFRHHRLLYDHGVTMRRQSREVHAISRSPCVPVSNIHEDCCQTHCEGIEVYLICLRDDHCTSIHDSSITGFRDIDIDCERFVLGRRKISDGHIFMSVIGRVFCVIMRDTAAVHRSISLSCMGAVTLRLAFVLLIYVTPMTFMMLSVIHSIKEHRCEHLR